MMRRRGRGGVKDDDAYNSSFSFIFLPLKLIRDYNECVVNRA